MISKPIRWRSAGIAALAALSLGLTALAAQVSPPNVRTVDEPAAASGDKQPGERVSIKLPASILDRYTGDYRMSGQMYVNVKLEGDTLIARLTGQAPYEIFPESEDHFIWKVVDAQIEFVNDGSGKAPSAVLHQGGRDTPMTRVDSATARQFEADLQARIQGGAPDPRTEAMLRKTIDAIHSGKPNYEDMEKPMADVVRDRLPQILALQKTLGPVTSIKFSGVGEAGWDSYVVQHANGRVQTRLILSDDGKLAGLMTMQLP